MGARKRLAARRASLSESSEGFQRLSQRTRTIAERLLDLSEFEFQHLVRAYEFFARTNRQDIAEGLLRQAGALAESPAQKLEVAVLRRKAHWLTSREGDPLALIQLQRADRKSRDRLERLQIARELFHHGRVQRARQVLEEQRIFDQDEGLEHVEFIAALQCGPWLKPAEFAALANAALAALRRDYRAKTMKSDWRVFFRRLATTVGMTDLPLAERWFRTETAPSAPEKAAEASDAKADDALAGGWKKWREELERANGRAAEDLFREKVNALNTGGAFEEKLATWVWARGESARALDGARAARPVQDLCPLKTRATLEQPFASSSCVTCGGDSSRGTAIPGSRTRGAGSTRSRRTSIGCCRSGKASGAARPRSRAGGPCFIPKPAHRCSPRCAAGQFGIASRAAWAPRPHRRGLHQPERAHRRARAGHPQRACVKVGADIVLDIPRALLTDRQRRLRAVLPELDRRAERPQFAAGARAHLSAQHDRDYLAVSELYLPISKEELRACDFLLVVALELVGGGPVAAGFERPVDRRPGRAA